jgi:cytochrome P450
MLKIEESVADLPLAPRNPLPYRRQLKALRNLHSGIEELRDAGGPVTRLTLAPQWLLPPIVIATSPQGGHDVLGRSDAFVDKTAVHEEMRGLLGDNLFDLPHDLWLIRRRALQPVFTKKNVRMFAGHMAEAAETMCEKWCREGEIDLDAECRKLTLRALGRSILGLDLGEQADAIAEPIQIALKYLTDRSLRPVRAPRWLPTPARRRARAAATRMRQFALDILQACRDDPNRDAPLVRALIAVRDPATGRGLTDDEIAGELMAFLVAGHDTTATTLAYALWALGHHERIQNRVVAEVRELGDRELTSDDVSELGYTVQVLREALRLCPPGATIPRTAIRDIEVDGHRVEQGSLVAFSIYAVQRDPAYWDDPEQFDPDRFTEDRMKGRDRWVYAPFGGGPRSCIGDHFAMLEATLALATIVRRADIGSLGADFALTVPFTMVAAAPVPARIEARSEALAGLEVG